MKKIGTLTLLTSFFILCLSFSSTCFAEYPQRPIKMIAAFRAGGNVDTIARILAKHMADELGQPVIVENKGGAGGSLGAKSLKMAKPDGYTIGINMITALTFNPYFAKKAPFTYQDFDVVGSICQSQEAFVTYADAPFSTWREMIDYGKKNGFVNYASLIPIDKIFTKAISSKEGLTIQPVPTKGGAAVISAVMGKHVDFGFSGGIHYSYVKAGKAKILAALSSKGLVDFPEIPTLKSLGYDIDFVNYCFVYTPKGVDKGILEKLSGAMQKAAQDKELTDLIQSKVHWLKVFKGPADTLMQIEKDAAGFKKLLGK